MEWKIGEIKQVNGEWYQCVQKLGCDNCNFLGTKYCNYNECSPLCRTDKTSVIFKKLEKVGEPFYRRWTLEGNNKLMQRYKIYTTPLITIDKQKMFYNLTDDLLEIEIKQTKEDMEENKLNLKPFDIQKAKDGKPVCTRDGKKARIICFDKGGIYPVIALVQEEGSETCHFYEKDGKCADSGNGYDLLMLTEKKEGWINVYENRCYNTKEEALENRDPYAYCMATVKVSWEE